jgi:hypothetical protein
VFWRQRREEEAAEAAREAEEERAIAAAAAAAFDPEAIAAAHAAAQPPLLGWPPDAGHDAIVLRLRNELRSLRRMPRRGEWPDRHLPPSGTLGGWVWRHELQSYKRWLAGQLEASAVARLNDFLRCVLPPFEVLAEGCAFAECAFDMYGAREPSEPTSNASGTPACLLHVVAARHAALGRFGVACGHDGGTLEDTIFDVRDPPRVCAAALDALGWPARAGLPAPRAGALVQHIVDCLEFHVAVSTACDGGGEVAAAGARDVDEWTRELIEALEFEGFDASACDARA